MSERAQQSAQRRQQLANGIIEAGGGVEQAGDRRLDLGFQRVRRIAVAAARVNLLPHQGEKCLDRSQRSAGGEPVSPSRAWQTDGGAQRLLKRLGRCPIVAEHILRAFAQAAPPLAPTVLGAAQPTSQLRRLPAAQV